MRQVTPRSGQEKPAAPFVENFSSGYIQRALESWPKQGSKAPWRVYQNYLRDAITLKWKPVDADDLVFSNPAAASSPVQLREHAKTAKQSR